MNDARTLKVAMLLFGLSCSFVQNVAATSPEEHLEVKEQGDFYVGGQVVFSKATRSDGTDLSPGEVVIDQTWVQYQIPLSKKNRLPVILVHSSWLTGKTYLSTPDGREGWGTYFVRQGFPTYIIDEANRGRSGYDFTQYNLVRLGLADPSTLVPLRQMSNERVWNAFRIGPALGITYQNSQFPPDAAEQYFAQLTAAYRGSEQDQKRLEGLIGLLDKIGPAVLLTHSSAGPIGWAAAIARPDLVRGIVSVEPVITGAFTDFHALANTPVLIVRGDFDSPSALDAADSFVRNSIAASVNAQFLRLPDIGIVGNSHIMMMELNNLEIADIIIEWIEDNVGRSNFLDVTKSRSVLKN
jgi:pimeloyl-ACP methyl ester carboxylesterase